MSLSRRLHAFVEARRPLLRTVPEQRLAAGVAVGALLWFLPGDVGVIGGTSGLIVLLLAAAMDWVLLPSRADLTVERELGASVGIGDVTEGEYVVRSAWARALRATIVDELPAGVAGGVGTAALTIPPRGSVAVPFRASGATRGEHALGPIGLRVRSTLGLVAKRLLFSPGDHTLVTPSIANVRRFRLLALHQHLHVAGVRALRRRGEGQSFADLREYALGDDPRHIDWKATARRRKLITREFSIEQSQTVFTLVDAGRSMTQLAGEFPRFEHALSAALVLTDVAAVAGDRVGTLVFDTDVRAFVPAQRGRAALRAVRNALIPVTATITEPDYAAAFRFLAVRQRRRALIIFFTDVIDVRASRALIAHVQRSAARHLVVVVALRNDAVFEASVPSENGAARLYEASVAEELIVAREEALERMRRAGVTVLDVSPRQATVAAVNRYLEIKARGAL